ncbi:MAG TPA: 16S rRNA (cytidine(1402)-2'-O)-methyltransferase [Verrucomicrobiae bacterium]|nr:16S rRNA (cytidine(1402)-2'-O)-methyltransferase [Verrucomicrobiae bacterium]
MLTIVPTPIGNMRDITLRALDALKDADCIACEDTRHSGRLLQHFEIKKPLLSFHEHSTENKRVEILDRLGRGENVALISDAGMPLISDPGFDLVRAALERGIKVEVLPGAQAAVTALVASGLAPDAFAFLGFLPQKAQKRKKEIERVSGYEETLIFYESPYRLAKSLADLFEVLGNREAAVARELTKKFEEVARGTLAQLLEKFSKREAKGEIVIVVAGAGRKKLYSAKQEDEEDQSEL